MARMTPRTPLPYRSPGTVTVVQVDFGVSELASDSAGAHAPWGDVEFPLPVSKLRYIHPGPAERPNLAAG